MIERYKILEENNEEVLYLYFNYDFEFGNFSKYSNSFKEQINKFIHNNKIAFNGTKIVLVAGSIVVGSLLFNSPKPVNTSNKFDVFPNNFITSNIYNDNSEYFKKKEIPKIEIVFEEDTKPISNIKEEITNKNTQTTINKNQNNKKPQTTTKNPQNTTNQTTTPSKTEPVVEIKKPDFLITMYRSNGTVVEMELEEYLIGVVAAEMPASFNIEALKAQSIAARTYAVKRIKSGLVLTDTVSTQSYKDVNQLKNLWGNSFNTYYNKIKNAVDATKGLVMTYNGEYIDAVYHSTSNGFTESSLNVWGNDIPYLQTVSSSWDLSATSYSREVSKDFVLINGILGIDLNENNEITILEKDESNRVGSISIGGKVFTGIEIRTLLGLRSTDFDVEVGDGKLIFKTRGFGHGVGMSQYGAQGMAKEGYNYEQILKHYYQGVNIVNK